MICLICGRDVQHDHCPVCEQQNDSITPKEHEGNYSEDDKED